MYDDFQIISNNIKYLREKKGYTQAQLAEAADLSVSHLSKVEAGQRRIGMKAYITVLKALGAEEKDFISLVAVKENENNFKKFQRIMKGCSEAEQKFLIETLESIKENLSLLMDNNLSSEVI